MIVQSKEYPNPFHMTTADHKANHKQPSVDPEITWWIIRIYVYIFFVKTYIINLI